MGRGAKEGEKGNFLIVFAPRDAKQHAAQVRAGASPAGGRAPADMTLPTQGRGAAWLVVVIVGIAARAL